MNAHSRFLGPGLLLLLAATAATAQVNPKNMDTAANPRGTTLYNPSSPSYGLPSTYGAPVHRELYLLWKTLPGIYESAEDGTKRTLTLHAVSPYVLSVEIRTGVGGKESVERGYLGLADASPSYTSKKIRFAVAYQPESLRKEWSCALYGSPTPDGITFESEQTDCSFTLGRLVSKLRFDATADAISLSDVGDGAVTLVKKASK
jgi:hypothetical protein